MQQVFRDYRVIKIFVLYHGCVLLVKAVGIHHQLRSVSVDTGTEQAGLFGSVSELYSGSVQFETGRRTIMTGVYLLFPQPLQVSAGTVSAFRPPKPR